jgi:hypothetical protein
MKSAAATGWARSDVRTRSASVSHRGALHVRARRVRVRGTVPAAPAHRSSAAAADVPHRGPRPTTAPTAAATTAPSAGKHWPCCHATERQRQDQKGFAVRSHDDVPQSMSGVTFRQPADVA